MTVKIEESTVELIDSMGSDLSVCNAARVSFHKESEWEYEEVDSKISFDLTDTPFKERVNKLSVGDQKLVRYLAKHGHWTPFAHAFLSFRIKANFAVVAQLFKHQIGLTANSVSRRYVSDDPTFMIPSSWRTRPENVKQGSSATETVEYLKWEHESGEGCVQKPISVIVEQHYQHSLNLYNDMLVAGVAPEQARFVLPQGANTEFIWSGSLAAFARVVKQRKDPHAQQETRDVALGISGLVPDTMQHSWAALTEN